MKLRNNEKMTTKRLCELASNCVRDARGVPLRPWVKPKRATAEEVMILAQHILDLRVAIREMRSDAIGAALHGHLALAEGIVGRETVVENYPEIEQ